MENKFEIELLPEALDFLEHLDEKARRKVYYNLKRSQIEIDAELFKKIHTHIWEFRTIYNGNSYRLFAFWDSTQQGKTTLVIATHGLLKKSNKTPVKEILKAEQIRKQYFGINK